MKGPVVVVVSVVCGAAVVACSAPSGTFLAPSIGGVVGMVAEADGSVTWIDGDGLHRLAAGFGSPTTLVAVPYDPQATTGTFQFVDGPVLANDRVYWTEQDPNVGCTAGGSVLKSIVKDGGSVTVELQGSPMFRCATWLTAHGQDLYWLDDPMNGNGSTSINAMHPGGGSEALVAAPPNNGVSVRFVVDDDAIYWTPPWDSHCDSSAPQQALTRVPLRGGTSSVLAQECIDALAVAGSNLVLSTPQGAFALPKAGGPLTALQYGEFAELTGVAVDASGIYWTHEQGDSCGDRCYEVTNVELYRTPIDGSAADKVADLAPSVTSFKMNATSFFWSRNGDAIMTTAR